VELLRPEAITTGVLLVLLAGNCTKYGDPPFITTFMDGISTEDNDEFRVVSTLAVIFWVPETLNFRYAPPVGEIIALPELRQTSGD